MARRGLVPGSTDLADIIELAVAVTAYVVRQIQMKAALRRDVPAGPNLTQPDDPAA